MSRILSGLLDGWWMFYETFWALIFGFTLSGIIQAVVTRKQMGAVLGDHRSPTIVRASFFGMVSSSCSYAASALAHSLWRKGADFTASMAFMFASTNLVVELGIVIWYLLGWQFALAEFLGGAIMITLIKVLLPPLLPPQMSERHDPHSLMNGDGDDLVDHSEVISWRAKLSASAGFTIGDFVMMRVEMVLGFIVAGLALKLVPLNIWRSLFISGHGYWSVVENAMIAPFLACISFVCSVGNIPLAAGLWKAGIAFGGVIAFIFADLISLPLVMIYRKYYGSKLALKLVALFWFIMSVSGLATEGIFRLIHEVPQRGVFITGGRHVGWNATTFLNLIGLIVLGFIFYLYKNPPESTSSDFAQDPICGMQVRKSDAPASYQINGEKYFFCMEGCRDTFISKTSSG